MIRRHISDPHGKKGRAAMTLVEVLATLAVLLVLAMSAVSMLSAVTDIGNRRSVAQQTRRTVERFAAQFRRDVQSASEIQTDESTLTIAAEGDRPTVRYAWDESTSTIRRTESSGQETTAVEKFVLSDRCDPTFSASQDRVTIVLKSGPSAWVVEASR